MITSLWSILVILPTVHKNCAEIRETKHIRVYTVADKNH